MTREIRIGSRRSELALVQTQLIIEAIKRKNPELKLTLVTMDTLGDKDQTRSIEGGDGKSLFTDTLEDALRRGRIDLCVHSLKDMPVNETNDLYIAAYSKREDPRDALVLPKGHVFAGLDSLYNMHVGCSSARRKVQLLYIAPGLKSEEIRGNVPTRLDKLDRGLYDAVVLAMAGLIRLGLGHRGSRVFSVQEVVPAAGQGILAVQARRDDNIDFLDSVNDIEAETAAAAELAVMRALSGGCSVPAAAYAEVKGEEIQITGMFGFGGSVIKDTVSGDKQQGLKLAELLAERLRKGANGFG